MYGNSIGIVVPRFKMYKRFIELVDQQETYMGAFLSFSNTHTVESIGSAFVLVLNNRAMQTSINPNVIFFISIKFKFICINKVTEN